MLDIVEVLGGGWLDRDRGHGTTVRRAADIRNTSATRQHTGAVDAADFYTGLVAELYEPLRGSAPDPLLYQALVEHYGEPALELGCGGGDPLIALRLAGLTVEGVDSSADILELCRTKARAAGVEVVLHHQRMEELALDRSYPLIYLAGPTFNLLTDDATAQQALERICAHLTPDGVAWIPLFVPELLAADEVGMVRTATDEQGDEINVAFLSQERDQQARTQRTLLRYTRRRPDSVETVDRLWELHWYTREGFSSLAASAGLTVEAVLDDDGHPAAESVTDLTYVLSTSERDPGSSPG